MKVLHLSTTPLVGAPGNICRALRLHEGVDARWAVLQPDVGAYARMTFELDLVWERDKQQVIEFAESCDVIHLHNFIGLQTESFLPLDFAALWRERKPMVRHFHSTPDLVAKQMGVTVQEVLACPIPKLVIAQYPERQFPNARLVPNIVFVPQAANARVPDRSTVRIGYAPSRFNSARTSRWDTKAYPEVRRMLSTFQAEAKRLGLAVEVDIVEQVSHAESLRRKALCDLFIDDLVTGSYHLNTLEALAMGVPCCTHLDLRTRQAVAEVIGRSDMPVIDLRLEDAQEVLLHLSARPDLLRELGALSQRWMQAHWKPQDAARAFLDAYAAVREHPHRAFDDRLEGSAGAHFLAKALPDLLWSQRLQRLPALPPAWAVAAKGLGGRFLRALKLHKSTGRR